MPTSDETWVPEWEPEERISSRLTALPTEVSQTQEIGRDLADGEVLESRTSQHQALAEEVREADSREHRQQAVAAAIPGVDSGILGFEDVTGRTGMATEEVEAAEQAHSSNLVNRTVSAVAMVTVVVLALYLGGAWITSLLVLAMMVALVEFYTVVRSTGYRPMALMGLLGVVGAGVAVHLSGPGAAGGVLVGAVGLTLLFYAAVARRMPVENFSLTLLGMIWVSLLCYGVAIGQATDGVALLVWVLLLNAAFDTSAYVVGRSFGTRPLSPSLSSGKTVQGLVGWGDRHLCFGCYLLHFSSVVVPVASPGSLSGGDRLGSGAFGGCPRIGGEAVRRCKGYGRLYPRAWWNPRPNRRIAVGSTRRLLSFLPVRIALARGLFLSTPRGSSGSGSEVVGRRCPFSRIR